MADVSANPKAAAMRLMGATPPRSSDANVSRDSVDVRPGSDSQGFAAAAAHVRPKPRFKPFAHARASRLPPTCPGEHGGRGRRRCAHPGAWHLTRITCPTQASSLSASQRGFGSFGGAARFLCGKGGLCRIDMEAVRNGGIGAGPLSPLPPPTSPAHTHTHPSPHDA